MWEKVGATAMSSRTSDARGGVSNESVRQLFLPSGRDITNREKRPRRRLWRGGISGRSRRWLWWGGLVVAGGTALGLVLVTLPVLRPSDEQNPSVATDPPPQAVTRSVVRPVVWQGAVLPVGTNGPNRMTKRRATGFSRDALGAAIAATHLSMRVDPPTGPNVFKPVLQQQARGDVSGWLRRIRQSYRDIAAMWGGVKTGRLVPLAAGQVVGWRSWLAAEDGRGAQVDLLVLTPQQQRKVFRINVSWHRGDWRLVLPPANADELFPVKPASKDESFTRFFPENDS